jgi:hypothetical protein
LRRGRRCSGNCSEEEVRERLLTDPGLAPRAATISRHDVQNIKRKADEAAWKLHNNELLSLEEHLRRHAQDVVLYQPQVLDDGGKEARPAGKHRRGAVRTTAPPAALAH